MLSEGDIDRLWGYKQRDRYAVAWGIEKAVRNATLDDIIHMMEDQPPKIGGQALCKYWILRLTKWKEAQG